MDRIKAVGTAWSKYDLTDKPAIFDLESSTGSSYAVNFAYQNQNSCSGTLNGVTYFLLDTCTLANNGNGQYFVYTLTDNVLYETIYDDNSCTTEIIQYNFGTITCGGESTVINLHIFPNVEL